MFIGQPTRSFIWSAWGWNRDSEEVIPTKRRGLSACRARPHSSGPPFSSGAALFLFNPSLESRPLGSPCPPDQRRRQRPPSAVAVLPELNGRRSLAAARRARAGRAPQPRLAVVPNFSDLAVVEQDVQHVATDAVLVALGDDCELDGLLFGHRARRLARRSSSIRRACSAASLATAATGSPLRPTLAARGVAVALK